MKGCVVERAQPSNTIDLYPLIREAVKTGVYPGPQPSEKALKEYYFRLLQFELPNQFHFYYLARRGRGHLGFLHALLLPGRWDGSVSTFWVDMIFIKEKRQKMGVGKKLLEALKKDASNMGIREFEFLCTDEQLDYWKEKLGAKKASNLMRVSNATL